MKNIGKSRRLRKKLHLGEFQELGFEFYFEFKEELSEELDEDELDGIDHFLDEFETCLETIGLSFTGVTNAVRCTGFITAGYRKTVSVGERQTVIDWLSNHGNIHEIDVLPLVDAWY